MQRILCSVITRYRTGTAWRRGSSNLSCEVHKARGVTVAITGRWPLSRARGQWSSKHRMNQARKQKAVYMYIGVHIYNPVLLGLCITWAILGGELVHTCARRSGSMRAGLNVRPCGPAGSRLMLTFIAHLLVNKPSEPVPAQCSNNVFCGVIHSFKPGA